MTAQNSLERYDAIGENTYDSGETMFFWHNAGAAATKKNRNNSINSYYKDGDIIETFLIAYPWYD